MTLVRAEELTYSKLQRLDFHKTLCVLPVSALEVHGPHLPLGMDFFMARWMAEESARRFAEAHPDWTVVLMPHLPVGTDELPLAGSMNVPPHALYRVLWGHAQSLARAGYRYIAVTNGHGGPRHAAALEYVCRKASQRYGIQMFTPANVVLHRVVTGQRFAAIEELLGRPLSEQEKDGLSRGEHAGGWETAFQLAANGDLVEPNWRDLECADPPKWQPLARLGARLAGWQQRRGRSANKVRELCDGLALAVGWSLNAEYGYGGPPVSYKGAPAVASVELGKAFRELLARDCLEVIEQVTRGEVPATAVRSIASDHAVIQPPFFRQLGWAAVLGVVLLVLL